MEIKFTNVNFMYDNFGVKKELFNDLTFTLQSNKINTFIGPNGSGKTTILKLIKSLELPDSGYIKIGKYIVGKDSTIDTITDYKFRIGMVFQNSSDQFICENVREELELGIKLYHYDLNQIDKRITGALQMVGLSKSYLDKNISSLSKGEKKLIAIASILVFNPKVILLDEPTNSLDYEYKNKLIKLLRMLKTKYNKTIVISSHDMDFVLKVSDNVYALNNGKIVLSGDKYDVLSNSEVLKKIGLKSPIIIEFSNRVYTLKNIKMGYRDEVNDLLKDIYRYVK